MQVTIILKKLERYFINQHSEAYTDLQEGMSIADINQKLKSIGLTFPPEVYELFQWKSGKNSASDAPIRKSLLFAGGIFESLDTLIEEYKIRHGRAEWEAHYFPLFTNGGGDYLLVNCKPNDPQTGYIYSHSVPIFGDKIILLHTSLQSFLEAVEACFDAGAYRFENGLLVVDDELESPILEKYEVPYEEDEDDF